MMVYLIIAVAILIRFVTHFFAMDIMANFAPITALAIFSAVHLPKKQAVAIPLAARLVSDLFIGFFSWPLMVAVYASHLFGILLGLWIKKAKTNRWMKIVGSSLIASGIFFLVTNFAFLYSTYPHNLSGIIQAYINGLPFLRGTLLGDLTYTLALFGGYELAKDFAVRKQVQKNLA